MTIVHPTTQAKAVVVENGAKTVRVDEPGFGYIGIPDVKVTGSTTVCTVLPTAQAQIANGKVIGITLSG